MSAAYGPTQRTWHVTVFEADRVGAASRAHAAGLVAGLPWNVAAGRR